MAEINIKKHRIIEKLPLLEEVGDSHFFKWIFQGAALTFALRITATLLSLVVNILLARALGPTSYGSYAYAMAWIAVLSVPGGVSFEKLLIRQVSIYQAESKWGLMGGILRRANQLSFSISVFLAILWSLIIIKLSGTGLHSEHKYVLLVSTAMLPVIALMKVRQSVLQGLHRVILGQLPESLISPILFIIFICFSVFLWPQDLNALWAVGFNLVASVIALLLGAIILHRTIPSPVMKTPPMYETRLWLQSALPLLIFGLVQMINLRLNIMVLEAMEGVRSVGVYAVASRGAELISFILISFNAVMAPTISRLYVKQDMERLQFFVAKTSRIVLLFALPISLYLIIFGHHFLSFFGNGFSEGKGVLAILSFGQLFNCAMGPVNLLLIMTGHERSAVLGLGMSVILNLLLSLLLIPKWDINGAAFARVVSVVVWNLCHTVWVFKKIKINPTALGRIR